MLNKSIGKATLMCKDIFIKTFNALNVSIKERHATFLSVTVIACFIP